MAAYLEEGRFFTAGNLAAGVAELWEEEKDFDSAVYYWNRAAEYYAGEHYTAQGAQCIFKAAAILALQVRLEDVCVCLLLGASDGSRSPGLVWLFSHKKKEQPLTRSNVILGPVGLVVWQERFSEACEHYERVAEAFATHNVLRLNIPAVFLRAGLCLIADGGPIQGGLYSHTVQLS